MVYFMPGGIDFCASSSAFFTSVAICVAFDPAICCTIPITAGLPLFVMWTLYMRLPSSILATSFRYKVWPVVLLDRIMFSYSVTVESLPL